MKRTALVMAFAMAVGLGPTMVNAAQNAPATPATPATPASAPAAAQAKERWSGAIMLPGGMKLDFTLHLEGAGDTQAGFLSIPMQGLARQALRDVKRTGDSIAFTLAEPNPQPGWAKFVFATAPDGTAAGTMTQGGQTFQSKMERLAEGEPDRAGLKQRVDAAAQAQGGDRWEGGVDLPGVTLGMSIRLVPAKGDVPASGTMSIPMQGLTDGTLHDVVIEKDRLRFVLRAAPAEATWAKFDLKVSADGATAEGTMVQMGQTFPAKFRKLAAGEAPTGASRPQEPKPPFPYASQDVAIRNEKAGITLAGTLTVPQGPGPHPVALLITGSGPQDRDETLLGHKPFLVIADHLTRAGIAVLRVDDRGVGKSEGNFAIATSKDFADDVRASIAYLRTRQDLRGDRVGLIGHSEGGLITSIVAGDPAAEGGAKAGVGWIVMLAGPGVSGKKIMIDQSSVLTAPDGADPAKVRAAADAATAVADLIEKDAPRPQIRAAVRTLLDAQIAMGGEEAKKLAGDAGAAESMTDRALEQLTSPWFRFFLTYDPRADLARIKVPVLALNGSLDMQVRASDHLPVIEQALKEGGNTDFRVVELAGLNHLFQEAKTGRFEEYAAIEQTVSPAALNLMTDWIRVQVGLDK